MKTLVIGFAFIATIIIILGLLDFFKSNRTTSKFVNESEFKKNRDQQIQMTLQTLEQLQKINVTAEKELKLEFFFYTNSAEKAKKFATEIRKLKYSVEHRTSAHDKKLFIITGWTSKMKMSDEFVKQWTKEMCEFGYKFDCEFDGWGTEPD
jgi:regulator of RNase E activity RraB